MRPGPDGIYWAEAPYMFKHGKCYYLFVNWYMCCKLEAFYEIRVCRSTSPTEGFVNHKGKSCLDGHGKLVKDRKGPGSTSVGPGHASIFEYNHEEGDVFVFSNHYYRPDWHVGLIWMSFVEHHILEWKEGWPEIKGERWNPMHFWNRNGQTTQVPPTTGLTFVVLQ